MTSSNENTLPWVEKYRPTTINQIISHKEILNTLNKLLESNKLPHMIFYGPPGTGKTTTILACAKQLYGINYKSMILELNASEDRGINVVRDQITSFCAANSNISNIFVGDKSKTNVKLVILDEADAMTYDAQFALRRIIELYTHNTRFCLICNYLTKIIPALHSRCQLFRFSPILADDHKNKIISICIKEELKIDDDALDKIIEISEGDMRKSLNLLQTINMSSNKNITLNELLPLIGYPSLDEHNYIIRIFQNQTLQKIIEDLEELLNNSNLTLNDIIREITTHFTSLESYEIKTKKQLNRMIKMATMFNNLADIEVNLSNDANFTIQLYGIASIMYNYYN
jgi:replication factor C subunit 3/5